MAIGSDEVFRVAGFVFSRTSVSSKIDGVPYTGITEVNIEEKREGELQYGQRADGTPLGVTSGLYTPGPFTFKTYIDTGTQIEQQLALSGSLPIPALPPGSYGNALFNFTLEIFENPFLPVITITVNKCKIQSRKFAQPTDAGGLMYEYECLPQSIVSVGGGVGLVGIPSILANYTAL